MAKTYQVTGACITNIPVSSATGTQLATFYSRNLLPAGVPDERIKHLLSVGLIEEVSDDAPELAPSMPVQGEAPPASVNLRSSKGDLIEYGVANGGDRAELDNLTREQLLDRFVRQQ